MVLVKMGAALIETIFSCEDRTRKLAMKNFSFCRALENGDVLVLVKMGDALIETIFSCELQTGLT